MCTEETAGDATRDMVGIGLGVGLGIGLGIGCLLIPNWGGGGSGCLKNPSLNCKTVDGGTISSIAIGSCCVGTGSAISLPMTLRQAEIWCSIDVV